MVQRWTMGIILMMVAGCAAPQTSPSVHRVGPFEVTERISNLQTADPITARAEALVRIARGGAPAGAPVIATDDRAERASDVLAPFGFQVKPGANGGLDLHQGDRLVLGGFSFIRQPSISASGKDFVMAVGHAGDEVWLLRPSGLQEWDFHGSMWVPPIFADDRLVEVTRANGQAVVVKVDGKEAYRQEITVPLTQYPVKRLGTWNGEWVLELLAEIVVEGKPLPYEESFGWHLVRGKPFYFLRQQGTYGFAYDGKTWDLGYEAIIYNACCEASRYNPVLSDDGAGFYAYKDKAWRFVTLQLNPSRWERTDS